MIYCIVLKFCFFFCFWFSFFFPATRKKKRDTKLWNFVLKMLCYTKLFVIFLFLFLVFFFPAKRKKKTRQKTYHRQNLVRIGDFTFFSWKKKNDLPLPSQTINYLQKVFLKFLSISCWVKFQLNDRIRSQKMFKKSKFYFFKINQKRDVDDI